MNAHTTTATRQFALVKYSTSRPGSGATGKELWDHYNETTLQARLECVWDESSSTSSRTPTTTPTTPRTTPKARKLLSMLLTISYMPKQPASSSSSSSLSSSLNASQPIRLQLVQLDLASFSSIPSRFSHLPQPLPIKGVFKDDTILLRYLVVSEADGAGGGEYRKMQIRFNGVDEAERFMNAVEVVCPFAPAEEKGKGKAKGGEKKREMGGGGAVASPSRTGTSHATPAKHARQAPVSSPTPSPTVPREKQLTELTDEEFGAALLKVVQDPGLKALVERVGEVVRMGYGTE
ncbi:hypothetical protein MNV49_001170 [Pseudohyphozyma bogoriensis]|nr:hypothetical protein MNV49_001170 [Pseudohyphozyma bogoriensis]